MTINSSTINGSQLNGSAFAGGLTVTYTVSQPLRVLEGTTYTVTHLMSVTSVLLPTQVAYTVTHLMNVTSSVAYTVRQQIKVITPLIADPLDPSDPNPNPPSANPWYTVRQPFFVSVFAEQEPTGRNWQAVIVVNSVNVTASLIDQIVIEAEESNARIARFTVQQSSISNLSSLIGKSVTINYINFTNSVIDTDARLFTGRVDSVFFDPIDSTLEYSCVDGFIQDFDEMSNEDIIEKVGGYYSSFVFDEDLKGFELVKELVNTQTISFERDALGSEVKSSFTVPGTLDYEYTTSNIVHNSLSVDVADYRTILNVINLEVDYRYERLLKRLGTYTWNGTHPCKTLTTEKFLTNDAVNQALEGTGSFVNNVAFTNLPPTGSYLCSGTVTGFNASDELRQVLNNGFVANVEKKFDSAIIEKYELTIRAPQSIESFGTLDSIESTSIDIDFDASQFFEDNSELDLSGTLSNGDKFVDQKDQQSFDDAILTIMNQLRGDIIRSHRENIVNFDTLIQPLLSLSQYARVNTSTLKATGKIGRFIHTMNINTGASTTNVELRVSRTDSVTVVASSDFNTVPTAPSTDTPSPSQGFGAILLGGQLAGGGPGLVQTVIGGTGDDLPDITDKNVFILNKKLFPVAPLFEFEGLQLIGISISEEEQGEIEFNAQQDYLVDIQNNELVLGI